ncbi:hypothetical protein M758_7G040400 [Ceratodon purpureus]|nr:hypothetical protein M758_7G040400 [Ceratodon purpureus]
MYVNMGRSRNFAVITTLAMLVVAFAVVQQARAQCGNVNSLLGCLGAATMDDQPTASCCDAMAAFAHNGSEACLCQAIDNPVAKSAGVTMQFAIQIPHKCNLTYKAGYVCNGMVVPGGHA